MGTCCIPDCSWYCYWGGVDMMSIEIYGCSDDLIEIDGDIREEFCQYCDDDENTYCIAVSDGTLLGVYYDDEDIWRFTILKKGKNSNVVKKECMEETDDNYSDKITITAESIIWIVFGEQKVVVRK